MSSTPYFTVYVPFHNSSYADAAEVALASLEAQEFKNFEIILIANDTALPSWAASAKFLANTVALGGRRILCGRFGTLAAVANAAASIARGKWIVRLDADDEMILDALNEYARTISIQGPLLFAIEGHWKEFPDERATEVMGGGLMLPLGPLRDCGGYDEEEPLKDGSRIVNKMGVNLIKPRRPVYIYHEHSGSMTCPI